MALLLFGASSATASAETISSNQTISVTAVVPPQRYIIINSAYEIEEIISNTPNDVEPIVVKSNITGEVSGLTPVIKQKYEALISHANTAKPGILYKKPEAIAPQKLDLVNSVARISILFSANR